ncbi:hypothetical protein BH11MYX1_BH11MYX1_34270 [soil metagenome]
MIKRVALFAASALLAVLASTSTARADVGVVVTGEATLQPQLLSHLETWLRHHGHSIYASALEPDAINTLIDCYVVEDLNCARKVIEARAKSTAIVYARVESAPASNGTRDISIVGYWMEKGHDMMAERRTCHKCTEKQMHEIADDLMLSLAATPPANSHVHVPDPKEVVAQPTDAPSPGPAPIEIDEPHHSRAVPATLIGIGAASLITGIVFLVTDEDPNPVGPQKEHLWDVGTAGAICVGAGAVVAGAGAYLWFRTGHDTGSAPVASVSHDSAIVGWAARF